MGPAEPAREPLPVRAVLRVASGLAVVAVATLVLGLIGADRGEVVLPGAGDPGDVLRVGVVPGQSVGGYLRSSRAELAALTDPSAPAAGATWALVSLEQYVLPGALAGMLDGSAVAQVYTRVPLAGTHTQVVRIPVYQLPGDVLSGMAGAAVQRDQEEAEYRRLSQRLGQDAGDAARRRARTAYETAAGTARAEAAAYRSGCSCVFAAVVHATPAALRTVADRAGVRAVDPAAEVRQLDRTEFRPPFPEQSGTIPAEPSGSPIPVPNGGSAIASRPPAPILSPSGAPVTSTSPAVPDPSHDVSATAPQERAAVPSTTDVSAAQDAPTR
ncbi:hypothetical protein GCM10010172_58480 [Paractinoplanes ferrugineus]|uniref:Uncharacterized protein n=1 Tax=Paractinoplanes ferrugineus TaxID=113564 RepID=A0A919MNI5_9ACTN|nr:hypothetical protein [Actinoplanes ferrugineus]GIE14312.1 hypothetical protein Afe05nite_61520 [Actinoplanes ferrugineus]